MKRVKEKNHVVSRKKKNEKLVEHRRTERFRRRLRYQLCFTAQERLPTTSNPEYYDHRWGIGFATHPRTRTFAEMHTQKQRPLSRNPVPYGCGHQDGGSPHDAPPSPGLFTCIAEAMILRGTRQSFPGWTANLTTIPRFYCVHFYTRFTVVFP